MLTQLLSLWKSSTLLCFRFDTEGTGKADGELVHDGVDHPYEEMENGELLYKTKVLQSCNSLPGFIDVFSRTDTSSKHAIKLLNVRISIRSSHKPYQIDPKLYL